jgi:hypothetical protein
MKNSAKAEARWAFAFALLSDAEYEQFITCITALYHSWSPAKKSRADNILKRLAL